MTVWIITPIFFDSKCFLILRDKINFIFTTTYRGITIKYIAVDDSSGRDPNFSKVIKLPDTTPVILNSNQGHQKAIHEGLKLVAEVAKPEDIVITMDSDGEDKPQDIPRLLEPTLHNGNPSLAVRGHREESVTFNFFYFFYRILFKVLTGQHIRSGNFACFTYPLLKKILKQPYLKHCYASSLARLNTTKNEIICDKGSRYAGSSKMSFASLVAHGIKSLIPFKREITLRLCTMITLIALLHLLNAIRT